MANETEVWDRKHCVFCVFSLFVKSTAEAKKKMFHWCKNVLCVYRFPHLYCLEINTQFVHSSFGLKK